MEEGRGRKEGGRGEGMTETDRDLHTYVSMCIFIT